MIAEQDVIPFMAWAAGIAVTVACAVRWKIQDAALLAVILSTAGRPTLDDLDAHRTELRSLLDAIRAVESGGDDRAVGDDGQALGPYQIWVPYMKDATDWCKALVGTHKDCHDRLFSERLMIAYWHRHVPKALADRDHEVLARTHNGGPQGSKRKSTIRYWKKVEKELLCITKTK